MPLVNPPLIAIVGPTASGKSELALKLAKRFHGAVLSADSQQVYKNAAVGTNQPKGTRRLFLNKPALMVQGVPHFLIGTQTPARQYSAVRFQRESQKLAAWLWNNGHVPILAGGTGLYVSAVVEGYRFPPSRKDAALRRTLGKRPLPELLRELKELDAAGYARIDKKNRRRVIRALEFLYATGGSLSTAQSRYARPNTLVLGITTDRTKLRRAIARRTKSMLRRGLMAETRALRKHCPRSALLNSIGYREASNVLDKKLTIGEAERLIATRTWQYAKRQITWFKRIPNVRWIRSVGEARKLTQNFLSKKR